MPDIQKVGDRKSDKATPPRREPYWIKLAKGRYLGFRKMTSGSAGTWLARYRDDITGKQVYRALGDFTDRADHERYDAAQNAAWEWLEHLGKGGSNDVVTVAEVCRRYVSHLRDTRGEKAADDTAARFARDVYSASNFASVEVSKLTPAHVEGWRRGLKSKPVVAGRRKGEKRADSTINRDVNSLRAALNLAFRDGLVTTNFAWRTKLAPIRNADRRRDVYIDSAQRRALIAASTAEFAAFARALSVLPFRPGAVASLTVAMFDKRLGVLKVGKDKVGSDRKIPLPQATSKFFAAHCKDKLPAAPIFANSQGRPWAKDTWGYHCQQAVKRAGLPSGVTVYAIRHSTITDLVHQGVDTLTVAQLSGTSVAMIEKHYGHLTENHARAALAKLSL